MFSHIIDHRKKTFLFTPDTAKPSRSFVVHIYFIRGFVLCEKGAIVQGHIIRQESSSNSRMAWLNNPPEFYRPTTNAI